ncbi:MAG: transposase [Candidatus Muproteobacteria bacterium RBG_16_62_13]|uniref:Transposase n=1 Tax=Candidatus Muproteobacteria bacterium RBG_16_62_13 TaxID=1817756 RepID=A0A1F6SY40_9PROT|nr:MAG: transposase [Candidatus Muproteobacteria bacterium RBG_16_62_13]
MKKRQSFTKEFKLEAVRLLERGDKSAADLARELGIKRNQLYKWQEQLQAKGHGGVFPGHGRRAGTEAKLAELKRENELLQEENAILKKAAMYFAKALS